VTRLVRNHRNNPAIARLAAAIRDGDGDAAVDALRGGDPSLVFVESTSMEDREPAGLEELRDEVVGGAQETAVAAEAGDVDAALHALDAHRLLCAHRRGPYGVTRWAAQVQRWLEEDASVGPGGWGSGAGGTEWYPGRPLLVTSNDYDLGLYNGDTGVVVETDRGPRAVFSRGGTPVERAPALLDQVQTVHAMTVHRAQGSQFAEVTVILPPPESPLLTRELLYTAVTRAEHRVRVVGSAEAVRAAVARPISRASGFARRTARPGTP
jgi:exodeoxyribonuclease V alpha subunit